MIIIFWSAATLDSALPSWLQGHDRVEQGQPEEQERRPSIANDDEADDRRRPGQDQLHSGSWGTGARSPPQPDSFFASANLLGLELRARRASTSALLRPTAVVDVLRH